MACLFSVAIFVRRFSEMGDMMRKIFVSATAMAVLCSSVISVAPALGLEFESDSATATETTSSTAQVIPLGTSRWVECLKITMKTSQEPVVSPQLKVKIETYTTCSYSHNLKSEVTTPSPKCPMVLESAALVELSEVEFAEGLAKLHCELKFKHTGGCEIVIKEPTTALLEYAWTNTDTKFGNYESLLKLRLEKLQYTITGATGCAASGTNGEYDGSIPIDHVIVPPTM
jgi:hypothetical protein